MLDNVVNAASFRFTKKNRLLKPADYRVVFNHPEYKSHHKNALMLVKKNNHSNARLGLAVAKKHCKKAIDRNRIKRIVRENFRQQQSQLVNCDIVFLSKPNLATKTSKELQQMMDLMLQKIKDKI